MASTIKVDTIQSTSGGGDWVGGGYRLSGMTVYSTVAAHTWTKPSGVTAVLVIVTAGGGGGAGRGHTGGADCGGGGGAGGTVIKFITSGLATGGNETATVGDAGDGGADGQNDGDAGSVSSFGSHCTTTAGEGGFHGNRGASKAAGGIGVEGTPVLNTPLLIKGGQGFDSLDGATDNVYEKGGYGGASDWGGGGAGATYVAGTLGAAAQAGQAYGSGGGGGNDISGAGAAGALGVIVIYEYKGGA